MANILYQLLGGENAAPAHRQVEVALHSEADAGCVKGAVGAALKAQCGREHYLLTRRLNQKHSTILNWRVEAYCAPADYRPQSWAEIKATLPGIVSILQPADREQAEIDERERLEQAAREAAEFFAQQAERRAAVLL